MRPSSYIEFAIDEMRTVEKMLALNPNILERNGEKAFVILPYEQYLQIEEALDDYANLSALRAAKAEEKDAPTVSLSEFEIELGIKG